MQLAMSTRKQGIPATGPGLLPRVDKTRPFMSDPVCKQCNEEANGAATWDVPRHPGKNCLVLCKLDMPLIQVSETGLKKEQSTVGEDGAEMPLGPPHSAFPLPLVYVSSRSAKWRSGFSPDSKPLGEHPNQVKRSRNKQAGLNSRWTGMSVW